MDCGEFKELSSAWALGALDEAEDAACAAHLASPVPHEGCEDSHREARTLTARLASAVPEHPVAARVWSAIEQQVRAERSPPKVAAAAPATRKRRPRRHTRPRHLAPV
jgi:hypothetical protein